MKTLKSNTMNMKKILLAGLILGGCCAPLSAQRTDTVRVYHQMLPEIKKVEVGGNAQVELRSGTQNKLDVKSDKKDVTSGNLTGKTLVLDQPCQYVLTLTDTCSSNLHFNLKDSACVTATALTAWPIRELKALDASRFTVQNQDTLRVNAVSIFLQNNSVMRIKSPMYIDKLYQIVSTNAKYLVETKAYDVRAYQIVGGSQFNTALPNQLPAELSENMEQSESDSNKLKFREAWNDAGSKLYDIFSSPEKKSESPATTTKKSGDTVAAAPTGKAKALRHRWETESDLYWGFLFWKGNASYFSGYLEYPASDEMHWSLSSIAWEIKEKYWLNWCNNLSIGIGISYDNYRLPSPENNHIVNIVNESSKVAYSDGGRSIYDKGKIRFGYLQLPVGYTFDNRKVSFSVEAVPGILMKAMLKTSWGSTNAKYTFKQNVNNRMEQWKFDVRLSIGTPDFRIYLQPSLLPIYTDYGSSIYPVRIGLFLSL